MHSDPSYKGSGNLEPIEKGHLLNAVLGTIGAIIGAVIGSIPWAILAGWGWYAGLAGIIVAFTAKFGFGLLGGKNGWYKAIIVTISTLIGAVVGTVAGYGIQLAEHFPYLGFFERIDLFFQTFSVNSEVRGYVYRDLAIGAIFAGIGIWSVIAEIRNEMKIGQGEVDTEEDETVDQDGNVTTEVAEWGEASGSAVGRITLTREKSFVGSAIKFYCILNVSHAEFLAKTAGSGFGVKNDFVKNSPNLTKVKNGQTVTIDIPWNINKFYIVAFTSTGKIFSNEMVINQENMNAAFNAKMKMGMTENTIILTQV